MINNLSKVKSIPIGVIENRPSNQLVLRHRKGKWITDKELEAIALKKYHINGKGITFSDINIVDKKLAEIKSDHI